MSETTDLPPGWAPSHLGVVQSDFSVGVDPSRTPDETFELYSVPSHATGSPEIVGGRAIGSNKKSVEPSTVLLCKINPRINRVWVASNNSPHRKIASTEWILFFPLPGLEARYLAHFLRLDRVRDFLASQASGVGGSLMRVNASTLRTFSFPVAPVAEQPRIADALDELFSDLEAGVAELERAREKLAFYRSSVLRAAVEGALTADWRAQHPDVEPASKLLDRILAERRRRWEEGQLRTFKAKGQEPPRNWRTKYREPVPPDAANLPPLPRGWGWIAFDQVSWGLRSGSAETSGREQTEHPVLKSSAVRPGSVDLTDLNYLQKEQSVRPENYLRRGDFLVTRLSGSVDYVGCAAVVNGEGCDRLQYPDRIFRAKLVTAVDAEYLSYSFRHPRVRSVIETAAKSTAGHQRISMSDLYPLALPLPPLAEQEAIVETVEDQLSVIDHLEADIDAKLKSAQALRQAILRHAFTGKLVPQDPNDEPASELLQRIAAERQARAQEAAAAKRQNKRSAKPRAVRPSN